MVGSNQNKKIAVVFAAVRALRRGNAKQLDGSDTYVPYFETKIGNLAFRELVGAYDLQKLVEILSAFVRRPLVRRLSITRRLANARTGKYSAEQDGKKRRCDKLFNVLGIRYRARNPVRSAMSPSVLAAPLRWIVP